MNRFLVGAFCVLIMTGFAASDTVVDSGQAFMGMGISTGSGVGNVQLWDPPGSAVTLYLDKVIVVGTSDVGADIRKITSPTGSIFGHIQNKKLDGPASPAEIFTYSGSAPNIEPFQEVWLGGTYNDRAYTFDPAIEIPQGTGVSVGMANTSTCIASFQWRQQAATVVAGAPQEMVVTNLSNSGNAFDSNESTYANLSSTSFYLGKTWSTQKTLTRLVLKSPTGRSFSGGTPGRTYSWTLEVYNGTTWSTATTGSYTEANQSTQSVMDVSSLSVTGWGHRITVVDPDVADHRVSEILFYF